MKIYHYCIGLTIISATIGFNGLPAMAESKVSQCKRFDQTMSQFSNQMEAVAKSDKSDPIVYADRVLVTLKRGIEQLKSRKFSDAKIQSFQVEAVNTFVAGYNDLASMANATETNNPKAVQLGYERLKKIAPRTSSLQRQFDRYCGAGRR
jgi:hypothetical protein